MAFPVTFWAPWNGCSSIAPEGDFCRGSWRLVGSSVTVGVKTWPATSLDDLAEATGLNRPSLYGAFGDKHALYIAALQRSRDESVRAMGQALALDQPLRDVLGLIYSTAIRVYRAGEAGQRGCFLIGTAVTQAVDDLEARDLLGRFVAESDALFADRVLKSKAEIAPGAKVILAGVIMLSVKFSVVAPPYNWIR